MFSTENLLPPTGDLDIAMGKVVVVDAQLYVNNPLWLKQSFGKELLAFWEPTGIGPNSMTGSGIGRLSLEIDAEAEVLNVERSDDAIQPCCSKPRLPKL